MIYTGFTFAIFRIFLMFFYYFLSCSRISVLLQGISSVVHTFFEFMVRSGLQRVLCPRVSCCRVPLVLFTLHAQSAKLLHNQCEFCFVFAHMPRQGQGPKAMPAPAPVSSWLPGPI